MNSIGGSPNIQTHFLNQIKAMIPADVSLADELSELLNISRDSAYRRIRGETVLSLNEVKRLHEKYKLSVDAILSPESNMVLLTHQAVDFEYSLKEWLKSLIENLEMAKSSSNLKLIFAAKDIPVFHYFEYPELASFKLFVWSKSVIKDAQHEELSFAYDIISKEILADAQKAWQLYSSIPSIEVWSDEVINGTLKQIEFYHECKYFAHADIAAKLCDMLLEFIIQKQEEASDGKKREGGDFVLYQNDVLIPDNTIFAHIQNQRIVYINYNTMDLLTTTQTSFCDKTEIYMNNLIKNSTLISSAAEKERNRFFNRIAEKINESKSRLI